MGLNILFKNSREIFIGIKDQQFSIPAFTGYIVFILAVKRIFVTIVYNHKKGSPGLELIRDLC